MFNWLSLVTGLFYIVLGIVVIVYKFFFTILEPAVAYALGVVLIIYGVFRIYRAISRIKKSRDEE
ncbi:C4-dicarboxylate ABC transporter [Chryseobacterium indologenes]|uniref:C4-dicarboxylate ABC transporter n=2 Tax=Chryseobacterium indologenes TaxID=253 RepID=A0AAD0Z016_CHRID|nr:C4-dicarboxylate ABC transporter [Chryseobacterium indologenes]ATN08069.1 C4-dicarboxylate ABC transporter [Chryseobacterium indologenes]AYY87089.1 C4-dicarboxylate ABC transporter [Chryseobacterium indologenes]AYZ34226.1 C4-dicarboxylate ABC transporter [Chryseobacterium indologenes]AZB20540.1 C4-dicarboxylate ABC transporter [Chryseobacterium indologenes]